MYTAGAELAPDPEAVDVVAFIRRKGERAIMVHMTRDKHSLASGAAFPRSRASCGCHENCANVVVYHLLSPYFYCSLTNEICMPLTSFSNIRWLVSVLVG
jgi:hypothetical protein